MPRSALDDTRGVSVEVAAERIGCDPMTLARHIKRAGIPAVVDTDGVEYYPAGRLIELVLSAAIPTAVVDNLAAA